MFSPWNNRDWLLLIDQRTGAQHAVRWSKSSVSVLKVLTPKKNDFNQHTACRAPVHWWKYTTFGVVDFFLDCIIVLLDTKQFVEIVEEKGLKTLQYFNNAQSFSRRLYKLWRFSGGPFYQCWPVSRLWGEIGYQVNSFISLPDIFVFKFSKFKLCLFSNNCTKHS